jgi:hypothetical protein
VGFKLVSVLVVAFLVIAAGCGGKKKSAAPGSAATTTSTAATTTGGTTTTAAPTFASTKNCAQLLGLAAKFSQAFSGASGNAKTSLTDAAKLFQAMASAAPSEIRGDFQTIAGAFSAYAQAFAKAGIKAGQTPTAAQIAQLQTAVKSFSTPKLQAASQRLQAWGQKNCGLPTTKTTG